MATSAETFLGGYASAALQTMARYWGVPTPKKTKAAVLQALVPQLYDPERVDRMLADLAPVERRVLDRLILAGGRMPTQAVRAELERDGLVTPRPQQSMYGYGPEERGSPQVRGSRKFEDIAARLAALGLVFPRSGYGYPGAMHDLTTLGRELWIPAELLQLLPMVALEPITGEAPPQVVEASPAAWLRDCYTLLSFVAREAPQLTMKGLVAKRPLTRLDAELLVPEGAANVRAEDELGRIPLLRALAEDLSLLNAGLGALTANPGIESFLRLPAETRLTRLYHAYRDTARWNELDRVPNLSIQGKSSLYEAPAALVAARRRVLAELAELPAGQWVPLSHLANRLRQRAYDFLLSRDVVADQRSAYYYGYGYGYPDFGPYQRDNELGVKFDGVREGTGWETVEAGVIRVIVTEALHWLGLVDLGLGEGQPTAFRITENGARLLHGEAAEAFAHPPAPQVVIQPNFQVFAFPPTGEADLFRLDQIAEHVRAEQAIEYELTPEALYRAQQRGLELDEIIAFLERVSTVELPQNVRRSLEEWGARHQRITIRRGVALLQAVDSAVLDALLADPELGPLLGRRLTPTAALIPFANLRALYERLLAAEQLPALSEGNDLLPRPVFSVDAAGRITFRQRLPSVQVLHVLRPIAEGDADGQSGEGLRLTRESLRRGARGGRDAEAIIALLERYHHGPLSDEVRAMVKRWAKDWGKGALVDAVLLQVERPELLADLMADPALASQLSAVPGAATLAVVRREALEEVRAALKERDMRLRSSFFR